MTRLVMIVSCGSLVAGLLLGAWVFSSGGWRSVLLICGVTIASTAMHIFLDRRDAR